MAAKKKTVSKKKRSIKLKNTSVPQPKLLYSISSKKPEEKTKRIFHAVGVMKTEQESYHEGVYSKFTPEQIKTHIPQYNVVPYSKGKTPRPLSSQVRVACSAFGEVG